MKTMPKNVPEERYRWIKPIIDHDISIKQLVAVCPFSERTIKYWLAMYRQGGIKGLKAKNTRPKGHPRETSIRKKERVLELRKQTGLGAMKLHWKLQKEGIDIHPRTIGKIINKEGLTRKYRVRKVKYKYVKAILRPGELVEVDVKYVPKRLKKQRYYQFTAIDCASRWRHIKVYELQSNQSAIAFLNEVIRKAPFRITAVKTDNGSCFTNRYTGYLKSTDPHNPRLHKFDTECHKYGIEHYLIDPGKPQQNGKVERSHRSDQEYFYDRTEYKNINELQYKIRLWNMYYNDLEHCGLNGLTPNQALNTRVQYVRT